MLFYLLFCWQHFICWKFEKITCRYERWAIVHLFDSAYCRMVATSPRMRASRAWNVVKTAQTKNGEDKQMRRQLTQTKWAYVFDTNNWRKWNKDVQLRLFDCTMLYVTKMGGHNAYWRRESHCHHSGTHDALLRSGVYLEDWKRWSFLCKVIRAFNTWDIGVMWNRDDDAFEETLR